MTDCWVLLKHVDRGPDYDDCSPQKVMGVYSKREDLEARIQRITQANKKYPMRQLSTNVWRVGPDEDEGFFGNHPVYLFAVESKYD